MAPVPLVKSFWMDLLSLSVGTERAPLLVKVAWMLAAAELVSVSAWARTGRAARNNARNNAVSFLMTYSSVMRSLMI